MKTIDFSKNVNYIIYRGAKAGIKKMFGGAFYTYSFQIAEDYARLDGEKNPCVYAFDSENLNLLIVDCHSEINDGIINFEKEEIEMYDGVRTSDYGQYLLFGTMDCKTGEFVKQSFEELTSDSNLEIRDYIR